MASAEPAAAPSQARIDCTAANLFLSLLGKDPASARLRAFPHRANPAKGRIGARKGPFDLAVAEQWQRDGRGIYLGSTTEATARARSRPAGRSSWSGTTGRSTGS